MKIKEILDLWIEKGAVCSLEGIAVSLGMYVTDESKNAFRYGFEEGHKIGKEETLLLE